MTGPIDWNDDVPADEQPEEKRRATAEANSVDYLVQKVKELEGQLRIWEKLTAEAREAEQHALREKNLMSLRMEDVNLVLTRHCGITPDQITEFGSAQVLREYMWGKDLEKYTVSQRAVDAGVKALRDGGENPPGSDEGLVRLILEGAGPLLPKTRDHVRLEAYLRGHFPNLDWTGKTPVDQALKLLEVIRKTLPTTLEIMWNHVIQPSLSMLSNAGFDMGSLNGTANEMEEEEVERAQRSTPVLPQRVRGATLVKTPAADAEGQEYTEYKVRILTDSVLAWREVSRLTGDTRHETINRALILMMVIVKSREGGVITIGNLTKDGPAIYLKRLTEAEARHTSVGKAQPEPAASEA